MNLISNILCCWKKRRRFSDSDIPVSVANKASKYVNEVAAATNWDDDDWDNLPHTQLVRDNPFVPRYFPLPIP